jgi:hypothetical protein
MSPIGPLGDLERVCAERRNSRHKPLFMAPGTLDQAHPTATP